MEAVIKIKSFYELSGEELYSILALRSAIFVVEQNSIYLDMDGMDKTAKHLCAFHGSELVGYARILPPSVKYSEPSVGRLAVASAMRKTGLGKRLLTAALKEIQSNYGHMPVRISAQKYLKKFYETYGFTQMGSVYMLDGIEHIEMLLA